MTSNVHQALFLADHQPSSNTFCGVDPMTSSLLSHFAILLASSDGDLNLYNRPYGAQDLTLMKGGCLPTEMCWLLFAFLLLFHRQK